MMWRLVSVLVAACMLAGCASVRLVESDVTSHSRWPAGRAPATFTFERLPSQQAHPEVQSRIEAAALPALEKAGFRLASSGPGEVTIQVGARETRYDRAPWDDPWPVFGGGWFYGGRRHHGMGIGLSLHAPLPYYVFDVGVLIRDARTREVLYETQARHDGRWADDALRAALFEAAMKDFPQPALSPRRVNIEIPR
jgi:hypothetical protein